MARTLSAEDKEYLVALRKARLAIVTGAQSYSIGGRSLSRADLGTINSEISRLESYAAPKFRRIIPSDR